MFLIAKFVLFAGLIVVLLNIDAYISKGIYMEITAINSLSPSMKGNLVAATKAKMEAEAALNVKNTVDKKEFASVQTRQPDNEKTSKSNTDVQQSPIKNNKASKNFKKALPYAAGVVVLAGLGFYLLNGRGKNVVDKNLKEKAKEELKEELKEIGEEIREEFIENKNDILQAARKKPLLLENKKNPFNISAKILPQNRKETIENMRFNIPEEKLRVVTPENKPKKTEAKQTLRVEADKITQRLALPAPKEEYICIGFSNGQPVYVKKSEVVSAAITPAIDGYKEIKNKINPLNDEIIAKIIKNKNEKSDEINRIIAENTKDGHIDFNIMRKVARDFSTDEAGRGADRFHQAAEILEQSYIREYIKPDGFEKKGLYNLFDTMKSDTELMSIYGQMPLEEAVNRINYLRYNDLLKCNAANDMTKETFFNKMFDRLIEKRQFKKYNDTFKIDGNFNDIMQINQGLRKNTEQIINQEILSKAKGTPLERLTQIAQNEPDAQKAAYIMEKAILNDFMSRPAGKKLFSELEKDILNNKVLFDIYKKMPKEQALQRVNVFRIFEIPPQIAGSDNEHTLGFLKTAAQKLGVKI